MARNIVASATTPFEAEDALRDWVRESIDEWFDQCPDDIFQDGDNESSAKRAWASRLGTSCTSIC